jgi:hypothetical protein
MTEIPIGSAPVVGRISPSQPVTGRSRGLCPVCGYPLVERYWADEGWKVDHELPKSAFPTLESAIEFLRRHP